MSYSFDAKRLHHIAALLDALTECDKQFLGGDVDTQEEAIVFKVEVRWYGETVGRIEDMTGNGDWMFEVV